MMSSHGHYVGVDGCKGGWVAVTIEHGQPPCVTTFKTLAELWNANRGAEAFVIDMPLGLLGHAPCDERGYLLNSAHPEARGFHLTVGRNGELVPYPRERDCDKAARHALNQGLGAGTSEMGVTYSGRGCTVFSVPCREVIRCREGNQNVANKKLTDRKLVRQSAGILPKIREVDDLLLTCGDARRVFLEAHPELLFCALNGGHAINDNKKSEHGRETRMELLASVMRRGDIHAALESRHLLDPRPGFDDVVDALVCVVAASHCHELDSLPENPPHDAYGLPMQMVYWFRPATAID